MALRLQQGTALDIALEGSVGSFQVGTGHGDSKSLEVKYFMTHVGLNFAFSSNDKLLRQLAPVREIFDYASLDFDEIMQRDIDDARVSAELVPYLLDEQSKDMIKLFPPIVIVVMPIQEGRVKPDGVYHEVSRYNSPPDAERSHSLNVIRSGLPGREMFQFEQPVNADGSLVTHDLVRLRLNTERTRLVIVDGQHRAMALLAIFRNLKDQWSDERKAPFKEYYSAWTPNFINRFNLNEINLPLILCTIPQLDTTYKGDFDMKKAARSIFLTLNKTARQVSDSRNKLLDDDDLMSVFMRRTLSDIKEKDVLAPNALRIMNVELDQEGDQLKIKTPVAITGVPHIYYMIEHMMFDSGTGHGIAARPGRFDNRTKLDGALDRLDGRNLLGKTMSETIKRDLFTSAAAEKLGQRFDKLYGAYIIKAFEHFSPYDRHCRAVLEISDQLDREQDRQLKPILLDGQGIERVFNKHRRNLSEKIRDKYFKTDVPQVEASAKRLEATAARIADTVARLKMERATRFFGDLPDKKVVRLEDGKLRPKAIDLVNRLFEELFTTIAFQAALVCGFMGFVERAELKIKKGEAQDDPPVDRDQAFEEYIGTLNRFFIPRSTAHLKRLIRVFTGDVADDKEMWASRPSNQTFRNVVYRAEMQPDQWPKYRYLLLELWTPTHPTLAAVVTEERERCRAEVFSSLRKHYLDAFYLETRKFDAQLTSAEASTIFDKAFAAYAALLKNLEATALDKAAMRKAGATVPPPPSAEPDPEVAVFEEEDAFTEGDAT